MVILSENNLCTDNYIVQLVLQNTLNGKSCISIYDECCELKTCCNFDISVEEVVDNRRRCKSIDTNLLTGYKIVTTDKFPSKKTLNTTKSYADSIEIYTKINHNMKIQSEPNCLIQFELETDHLENIKLKFVLNPIYDDLRDSDASKLSSQSSANNNDTIYAFFVGTQFIHEYESPYKCITSSLIDNNFNVVGDIRLEYNVIKPWKQSGEFNRKLEKFTIDDMIERPIMVGHRGLGETYCVNPSEYMENSINSFLAAYECGADFVELDIQLTKDNKIVVYHDDDTCILLNSYKNDLNVSNNNGAKLLKKTLSNCKKVNTNKKLDYSTSDITDLPGSISSYDFLKDDTSNNFDKSDYGDDDDDAASCSTLDSLSSLNVSIRHLNIDQLKSQKFINSKSDFSLFLKNDNLSKLDSNNLSVQSNDPIGSLFPTLGEVLSELPQNLGVNIEIKSPQHLKTGIWENDFGQNYDRNLLVDRTLKVVFDEKQKSRKIIFSSFDPWICSICRKKQNRYPVLFLIAPKSIKPRMLDDLRLSSLDAAILFAKAEKFEGIVCCIDHVIDKIANVSNYIKELGLILFTYGEKNNYIENVLLQNAANVDGIITDRLKQILPQLNKYNKS